MRRMSGLGVSDLKGKGLEELMEILERQEKLLNNKTFLARLPDKGKRILDFTETVRLAISEQKELNRTANLFFTLKSDFQAAQFKVKENTIENVKTGLTFETSTSASNDDSNSFTRAESYKKADFCFNADILENDLRKININDSEETNQSTPKTSTKQEINSFFPNAIKTKSNFLEVLEKRKSNPVLNKEKFRTNNSSPGGSEQNAKKRAQEKKHLDDITAARLPPLHHTPAQLLTLDESVALQLEQKKKYEEQQAKLAAQKLFEKLNIKMTTFNPEGDSYLKYRDLKDEEEGN
ncbi:hypothetical protein GDO86_006258 [Hymenochirus boettgeri]|uniref:DNA-directed RNA polymerase II subunit GRINL1A n=1 Tax=Hymenochirus boettgeri TaxID=247094 RepID=A0A8T2JAD4_9PIPI|nr:hypothetical protein GDO86_006258 [Hymenochirus boettgeri]